MLELLKKKKKTILKALGIMFVISIYLAMIFRHVLAGKSMSFNPITLIRDMPQTGFSFSMAVIIFLLMIGGIVLVAKKNNFDLFTFDERNFKYSDSGVYGTAGKLDSSDIDGYAKINTPQKAEGTILGQLDKSGKKLINTDMKSRMNKHVAVFGCSGSGKSRGYARPFIIQTVKRRESVIVTDPKGELYESTAQYLKDNGYIVRVFDLVHPDKSDGWDCLKELRGDEIRAQIFASVVIQNTGTGKGDVWDNAAMSLLKALMLRVERGHDYKTLGKQSIGDAYDLIQNPLGEKYLDTMFDSMSLAQDEQLCVGPYMTFKQGSDNMRGNIITGLSNRLQVFQADIIKRITAKDDIDLTLPAKKPCAYFCIMSDQHSALNFLSTLFFSFAFIDQVDYADTHGNKCPVPINYLLDEFPNIGTIADFEKKIATVRSRDINISVIFQNITQLEERYPNGKWQTILSNCDTHLLLGCNDPITAKFISDRAGETTVKVGTVQHEKIEPLISIGHKHSSGDGKRKIYTPDEILRFPLDRSLIIFRGKNVMEAYKYDFSQHPEANKFRDVPITERPSITDTEGRKRYEEQDRMYLESYLKQQEYGNRPENDDDDDTSEQNGIFSAVMSRFKPKDEPPPLKKEIPEGADIELDMSDFAEYWADEPLSNNEITFADE